MRAKRDLSTRGDGRVPAFLESMLAGCVLHTFGREWDKTRSTALDLRKLGYLGHMGRYAPDRLERQLAFGQLNIEGDLPRASKQGTTWRTQCCSLLVQLRLFFPESFRDLPSTALAAERDVVIHRL